MFDTNNLTADPEDANAEPQGGHVSRVSRHKCCTG